MENTTTISLLIEGIPYNIDQDTNIQLQNGMIPRSLQEESKRQILMRSDTKLPQPFASWSNSL